MILLDTSFIVAFHNFRDVHHAAAKPVMNDILSGKWGKIREHRITVSCGFLEA